MNTSVNDRAYFDVLAIGQRLEKYLGDLSFTELHLFAYLSCLLSLYQKQPASAWGYQFAVTEYGYPYSAELQSALELAQRLEYVVISPDLPTYGTISEAGIAEYDVLRSFARFLEREICIDGACSSLLALPVGTVRSALGNEGEIRVARALGEKRLLLSETTIASVHDQFATLSSAIGVDVSDLMVPAVVWLTYLAETDQGLPTSENN